MSQKDEKLSQPRYTMQIEKDVKIPMRDGAILYADVFRPDGGASAFPRSSTSGLSERQAVDSAPGP